MDGRYFNYRPPGRYFNYRPSSGWSFQWRRLRCSSWLAGAPPRRGDFSAYLPSPSSRRLRFLNPPALAGHDRRPLLGYCPCAPRRAMPACLRHALASTNSAPPRRSEAAPQQAPPRCPAIHPWLPSHERLLLHAAARRSAAARLRPGGWRSPRRRVPQARATTAHAARATAAVTAASPAHRTVCPSC